MNLHYSIGLLIGLAVVAANLPFLVERVLLVGPFLSRKKPFWLRLLELALLYVAVGLLGCYLEAKAGQIAVQDWSFYAITGALFATFAFPGFVVCYLVKR